MNTRNNPLGKKYFTLQLTQNFCADIGTSSRYRPYRKEFDLCEATWDEMIPFLASCGFDGVVIFVGDCLQYESHPELSLPGCWSKEKLQQKLSVIRDLGMEAIPMLDFGAAKDAWLGKLTPEDENYLSVAGDLIRELCRVFSSPKLFHLGFGEESSYEQRFQKKRITRPLSTWFEHVNHLCAAVKACGVTPWIWADRFLEDPEAFAASVSRDVILSTQSYGYIKQYPDGRFKDPISQSAVTLSDLGYSLILANSISKKCFHNCITNLEMGKNVLSALPLGHLVIPFSFTDEDSLFELKHSAFNFKCAVKEVYPEGKETNP